MTDKEKLEAIKAEIERRISKLNKPFYTPDTPCGIALQTYKEMLSFIDSLSEEPVSEDLEKELDRWYEHDIGLYKTREQFKEMIYHFLEIQKKQMIKQAVDAKACAVYPLKTCNEVHYSVQYPIGVLPQKDGDKVKVIIIKEE